MQNSPTVAAPPPIQFTPPPRPASQITVVPFPPPPPFPGAPTAVFQITVLPIPPPVAGAKSSINLSPLEFLLALLAIVTIPALIYTFIFAFGCPTLRRLEPSSAAEPSVASGVSHHEVEISVAEDTAVHYQRDMRAKEIDGECPVCLSAFGDGEEVRQLNACKHSFHASCIDLWLSNHSNCPICRTTITTATKTSPSSNPNGESNLV